MLFGSNTPETPKIPEIIFLYQFTCLSNGCGPARRIFKKLMKKSSSHLRSMGHDSVAYVDYSYLEGDTYKLWVYNIMATIQTLRALSLLYT